MTLSRPAPLIRGGQGHSVKEVTGVADAMLTLAEWTACLMLLGTVFWAAYRFGLGF